MNLYIFGDSIMEGVLYSEEQQKYKIRQNKFSEIASNGINIKNNSRMGATITKCESVFNNKLDKIDNDSIIVFEFGGNDCDFNWADVSSNPDSNHLPNTSPEEFIEKYSEIINKAKETGCKVAITNLVPIDASKYMNWISKNLSYENILSWLGDVSMLSRWHEYYNMLIEKLAIQTNTDLIDVRSKFLTSHQYKNCLCADGIHPSETGYSILDNVLNNYVSCYA